MFSLQPPRHIPTLPLQTDMIGLHRSLNAVAGGRIRARAAAIDERGSLVTAHQLAGLPCDH